ncbi:MAG: family peptidase [Phenylobacterium sp.]|nr:family peptidase [Phenylobacterium sp.]
MRPLTITFAVFAPLALAAAAAHAADPAPPSLAFPLACKIGVSCEAQNYVDRDPGPGAADYRCSSETYEKHNGVDIRLLDMAAQRRGVDVLAAASGRVSRLRDGVADISVKAPGAPSVAGQECGNGLVIDHGGGWETQYCHMARGSLAVKVGQQVVAGTKLGQVGLSGSTEYPHLHITVRHGTTVIDPFAPGAGTTNACKAEAPLWSPAALAQLAYKPGAVLNTGFAAGPVKMEDVEAGGIAAPGAASPYLVAYGRGINLRAGDVVAMELRAPAGQVLAKSQLPPLDHAKAQHIAYIGVKRPPAGWAAGRYKARYQVLRDGKPALGRDFEFAVTG